MQTWAEASNVLAQLHLEIQPLADVLQEAGQRGSENISFLPGPMRGKVCSFRAFQRDPYIMGFHDVLPDKFGSFIRNDDKFAARRLVYTSTDLKVELAFRRGRAPVVRQSSRPSQVQAEQLTLYPDMKPDQTSVRWRAALLWDCPTSSGIHTVDQSMPFRLQLAAEGTSLDDKQWIGGFSIDTVAEDLIPQAALYRQDDLDWDIDEESGAQ